MALPATDDFTNLDNWTMLHNSFTITAGVPIAGTSNEWNVAYWDADTFANDQYSQIVYRGEGYGGPTARCAETNQCYQVVAHTSEHITIRKMAADGTMTTLYTSDSGASQTGDVVRIEVTGSSTTTIKAIRTRSGTPTEWSTTDSSSPFTSGSAGIGVYAGFGNPLDDWEGGNLDAPAATFVPRIIMIS